jgi:hypothetical protein
MRLMELPDSVAQLCAMLARIDGVEAVTIGGSRATETADESSDWDVGVYYRGAIDLAPLTRYGEVHPPGSWGRVMNGGAWLSLGGTKVDVLLRELGVALYWTGQARLGLYEVDALLGYIAGVPTYSLMAELALNRTVNGLLPEAGEYPDALSHVGARRWALHADFSLIHARMRAERGDLVGTVGQVAKAVIEMAHAVACRRRMWVLNEKKLIERTGLQAFHAGFANVPSSPPQLVAWVDTVRTTIARAPSIDA